MSVYIDTLGNGPNLVMLHGWGLHGGIWDGMRERLSQHYTLHLVDLPGHGRSPNITQAYNLLNVAEAVLEQAPQQAVWMGWSLGGRVAMQSAILAPERVSKLISVAASPRFLKDEDWPGVELSVLQGFADSLEQDYKATLLRFLAIQAHGSERAKDEIRILRQGLFAHGEPQLAALRGGLGILQACDLRQEISAIKVPSLFLAGRRDALMPYRVAQLSANMMSQARAVVMDGAGHAPFISHPYEVLHEIRQFIDE
ncbi:MAG: pimeloyl-ACP methyl ester esterase BioH [Gammaproteobacteria bacterium]|nr:pimeloyl-ACP methyl ester esterase BioH [Gammaproteobacteria bacterium]